MNQDGAAGFHRQLVKGDLASEYSNDIRLWLEELKECEEYERSMTPPTR
jgi:serine/threonine-protein kinase